MKLYEPPTMKPKAQLKEDGEGAFNGYERIWE